MEWYPAQSASLYLRTSFAARSAFSSLFVSETALYSSSSVVKIFSISVELLASCKAIVFTSMYGFGNLITFIFTDARALEADTSFFKISISLSISDEGGRRGRSLNGIFLSNFDLAILVQYLLNYGHAANLCHIFNINNNTCPIF